MRVLVTGGSGVVGSALVRMLIADGAYVSALARSDTAAAKLEDLGAHPVRGDVVTVDPDAFVGSDVVYHVAGINELCPDDPEHMSIVNIEGTRNVVRGCHASGVRRMVHTSSVAILGHRPPMVTDETLIHSGKFVSHYAATKWGAEKVAFSEVGPCEVVAVNPASVQGPGRATGTAKIILDLAAGKLPALVDTAISIVDIEDCARGHILAAERGTPGERYILSGFTVSIAEALALLERLTGRPTSTRLVSSKLLQPMAPAAGRAAERMGISLGGQPLCREMLDNMLMHHVYDGSKATRDLGLTYRSPEVTLQSLLDWAESEGHYAPVVG